MNEDNNVNNVDNRALQAILAYIGILVVIPYLMAKNDPFVKFHIKQGLVLLVIEIVIWAVGMTVWMMLPLIYLLNLAVIVLSIIGIVNVVNKQEKELPLVGQLAKHFKI
jgi:uncharacterized membrane protein